MKHTFILFLVLGIATTTFGQKLIPFDKSLYKSGLKNEAGKVVVKPIYNSIEDDGFHFILHGKNNQTATLMTYDGKILIGPKYVNLESTGDKRYYKATGKDAEYKDIYGYVDVNGNELVPVKYYEIEDYYSNMYLFTRGKYKEYGLISVGSHYAITKFREVTPPIHADLTTKTLADGRFAILVKDFQGRYATLDSLGNTVHDYVNWSIALNFYPTETWTVEDLNTKKWALVNPFFEPITPFDYDYILPYLPDRTFYITEKNNMYGLIDKFGKTILEPNYQTVAQVDGSMLAAKSNNKWGIFDPKGKQVLPFVYDSIGSSSVFEIDLKKDNRWRRMDIYTGEVKTEQEVFASVVAEFDYLAVKIVKDIDNFAHQHAAIRKAKYTTEYELQKQFTELLNTKGHDLKFDIRKATNLLSTFMVQYPNISAADRAHINEVIEEFNVGWSNLDNAKNYKETIFVIKEETVEGVIEDVLKSYEK